MKYLLSAAALAASLFLAAGAQAQVVGSVGGGSGSFLSLSSAGLDNGAIANLTGGTVYDTSQPAPQGARVPAGTVYGGTYLAVGPSSGTQAVLSFAGPGVGYVSFLWGSPDAYNLLTVTTTGGVTQNFDPASIGLASGANSASQFVQFQAAPGSEITSLTFGNSPETDAFETASYSITPVPEPATCALLAAGLGAVAFVSRRRRS